MSDLIQKCLNISAPSWPLQNSVAVNPFWFLRDKPFYEVTRDLASILNTSFFMPFAYYRDALDSGSLTREALQQSIKANAGSFSHPFLSVDSFLVEAEQAALNHPLCFSKNTLSEFLSSDRDIHTKVILDFGKYASGYMDEKQAISAFPWASSSFWDAWIKAQKIDRSMEFSGFKNFRKSLEIFDGIGAEEGIALVLQKLEVESGSAQEIYLQSLLASVLGWSSQFKYIEWQKQLGYEVSSKATALDLLAVRMAYDFGIYHCEKNQSAVKKLFNEKLSESKRLRPDLENSRKYLMVLQLALELSYQKKVAQQLNQKKLNAEDGLEAQVVFCIDVRSELLRRNIEDTNSKIETIGFAGFFGVPLDFKSAKESKASHRLPVLLAPAVEVEEVFKKAENFRDLSSTFRQVASYFRNLRKNPLSSFLYVELFGALYVGKTLRRSFLSFVEKILGRSVPHRFHASRFKSSWFKATNRDGTHFEIDQKIEWSEKILRHMGLVGGFPRIVLLLGHGSVTTNNAFGSSLDCGACGGHAGDINARFLTALLNDSRVRKGLEAKNIFIPSSTHFIAGVHETVSDQIFLLEDENLPLDLREDLDRVMKDLEVASENTRKERFLLRPESMISQVEVRSRNWSEVRPEWGLAGNACFIIAPRIRTEGLNLKGRSFLHDYHWKLDEQQNFKTLELIMTAPMIVTNWINLQYFASTVAPTIFGSGSKILHNLVNETGVYEGNGGDLRVGLPFQSVHDGKNFVHDPLRLSVFIEAPKAEVEKIIREHEVVRQLVDNDWLHLVLIDPFDFKCQRRTQGGAYLAV